MKDKLEEFRAKHHEYLYVSYKITELAKELKVTRQTIYNWLKGKTRPKPEQMKAIEGFINQNPQ